ncbi:hydantoinase B/oxoprolinase family protein [Paracoccus sp. S-4012]|uniref:hydantoinase B/oxoprolinase family protein n=1 Tax=Paracoccus sp. S-4012 TaxID=2665648 RepID=UPI0012B0082B|nr:hydantoinase B/oxoprolinase family protein [Paracoccus sp. S-4012]MRX51625.1 hydantoinase B/oxoprolinase family protein [Paracoccus sp. S-4012]
MTLDATEFEILRHKTTAAAEEMGLTLQRSARTIYVKEVSDFATAIAGLDGKAFAYPEMLGVSAFVDLDLRPTLAAFPDLAPGDVILSNLPYANGALSTHLPDLQLVRPFFHGERLIGYGWSMAHTSDIGGGVPSSISPRFSDIYQEGLQIPPVRLLHQGRMDDGVLAIYRANCRSPRTNMGDVRAMLSALETGERRIAAIAAAHGDDAVIGFQTQLADYACEKARPILDLIPEGSFDYWDYLDHDFVSNIPVRLRCRLTREGSRIHLDFTGTDPQLASAFNLPTAGLRNPYLTIRLLHLLTSHDPTAPYNHGLLRDIEADAPAGSVLNPQYPAACGVRHATVMRLIDTVSGALHLANPALAPVAGGGTVLPVVLVDHDPVTGEARPMVIQSIVCGSGARDGSDGVDGREAGLSNTRNSPIERTEDEAPVLVEHYGLRCNSGGPGRWRGGCGLVYTIRMLKDDLSVLARGLERFRFAPWGGAGGRPAPNCRVVVNIGREDERELMRIDMLPLRKGDTITFMTPGGGGFGDPFSRPPEAVLADVLSGFVSIEAAACDYGVAIRGEAVDAKATTAFRDGREGIRSDDIDAGSFRENWDAVLTDALVCRMIKALEPLPPTARARRRRRLYEAALPALASDEPLHLPDPASARAAFEREIAALEREVHA